MKDPRHDRWIEDGWKGWLWLYGGWTAPALIVLAGSVAIGTGYGPRDPAWVVLVDQLAYYWFFASMTPLVYRLENYLRWTRRGWPIAVLAHLVAALTALAAERVVHGSVRFWTHGHTETWVSAIEQEFFTATGQWRGLVSIFYYVLVVAIVQLVRQRRARADREREAAAWRLRLSRMEAQLAQARLRQLENRLNPHFLFNALNSVAALVRRKDHEEAYRAIELLGTLLRRNLDPQRPGWVSVREELDFLELYLSMERLRFSDRLTTEIHAEPDCLELQVPSMILQPLVENAVRHAIASRPEPGRIEIHASRTATGLRLKVRDDGPGLPQNWTPESASGLGLRLVRQRLETHYGAASEFRLESASPRGVLARLDLPTRNAP